MKKSSLFKFITGIIAIIFIQLICDFLTSGLLIQRRDTFFPLDNGSTLIFNYNYVYLLRLSVYFLIPLSISIFLLISKYSWLSFILPVTIWVGKLFIDVLIQLSFGKPFSYISLILHTFWLKNIYIVLNYSILLLIFHFFRIYAHTDKSIKKQH